MKIKKSDLPHIWESYNKSSSPLFEFNNERYSKKLLVKNLILWILHPSRYESGLELTTESSNPLINDFIDLLEENDCANLSNTPGMGPIVSAQPGAVPGGLGTIGSGDVSKPLLTYNNFGPKNLYPKKRRKKKKSKQLLESLEITTYSDLVSHINKYSSIIGEKSIQRTKDLMEWLAEHNLQFQKKEDIWIIIDIRPSLSALVNKGLVLTLKKEENEVLLNISAGDEKNPFKWKFDMEFSKQEEGDLKKIVDFLQNY